VQNILSRSKKSIVILSSLCLSWALSTVVQHSNEANAANKASGGGKSSSGGKSSTTPSGQCWEIDYSSSFAGIVKVKFYDKAMNLKLEKMGLTVVAHAPKWDSNVYNELNKKSMSMTDEQWKTKFASNFEKHRKVAASEVKVEYTTKTEKIQGITATKVVLREKNPQGVMDVATELWVAKTLISPPQFKQFIAKALRVPADFQGTPLRISVNQKGQMVQALDAYKVVKMAVNEDDYKPLSGYKLVKNEINLMMDDDDDSMMGGGGTAP
jgi:hypothetical protein